MLLPSVTLVSVMSSSSSMGWYLRIVVLILLGKDSKLFLRFMVRIVLALHRINSEAGKAITVSFSKTKPAASHNDRSPVPLLIRQFILKASVYSRKSSFSYLTRYLFTLATLGTLGEDQETSMLSEVTSLKRRSVGAGTAGAGREHHNVISLFPNYCGCSKRIVHVNPLPSTQ